MKTKFLSLLTILMAVNVMPVFGTGGGPTGMSPDYEYEDTGTTSEPKGTVERYGTPENEPITPEIVTNNASSLTTPKKQQKPENVPQTNIGLNNLDKVQQNYDDTKNNEQSNANKILTTASTAATGIGGMELAQGLAEQRADKTAEQSMSNYIATMRCKYGDTQVKAGLEEIELPGGNDSEMAKYRNEYFALATDLKERKTALGMAPGIESEEILDKSKMGLYTQENIGISDGAYASLYRAQMYNSESDKAKINEAKEASSNRVTIGATAAGIGVVGGIIGDQMINGNLGKKKNYRDMSSTEFNEWIKQQESSQNNLSNIRDCLKNKESSLDFNKLIQECAK